MTRYPANRCSHDQERAGFDAGLIELTAQERLDNTVEVRHDILEESDGPMLVHGLKEMHNRRLEVPRRADARPSEVLLEE